MATLLEQARAVPKNKHCKLQYTREHYELAIAWLDGQITLKQFAVVVGAKNGNGLYHAALILREAFDKGYFTVKAEGKR